MKKRIWSETPLSVYFPVARQMMIVEQERGHEGSALLVLGDKDDHDLVARSLSMTGLKVVSVDSGYAALQKNLENPFAIILADLQVPGTWTFARHIKEKSPEIPVVLITGQPQEGTAEIVRDAKIEAVLFKPLGADDVLKTVQEIFPKTMELNNISNKAR